MEEVVVPACARNGITPVRADSLARAGEINEQIFRRLRNDDIVIADLTGANANVMYELGLRHTRDKLTVQIGEFGRLPFDINMIRTIQFSRSPVGLITARDELILVLETGIAGDYDPVTATRVWAELASLAEGVAAAGVGAAEEVGGAEAADEHTDDRGFMDIVAESEEQLEVLPEALEAVAACVRELGELAVTSATEVERSDAANKGMRGRLQVATKYAQGLAVIADRLDGAADHYVTVLSAVSGGVLALIDRMEEDSGDLEVGQSFGMVIRQLAAVTRGSMAELAVLVDSTKENAALSRVLRKPSAQLATGLDRFTSATAVVDEWDRRLQSLGIPVPPEDWEPAFDEQQGPSGGDGMGSSGVDGVGSESADAPPQPNPPKE